MTHRFACRSLIKNWDRLSSHGSTSCKRAAEFQATFVRHFSESKSAGGGGGGAGYGNVHDRLLPISNDLYVHCKHPKTVSIIGAPMTYGQPFVGTDSGPMFMRESGLRSNLTSLGWRVEDLPDLDFDQIGKHADASRDLPHAKNCAIVGAGTEKLAEVMTSTLQQGRFPLVLGGDHSIGIGTLAGILKSRPQTGVLWIDAHADLNTPDISESGNLHGMPVGLMMEGMAPNFEGLPGFEWLCGEDAPRLQPDSIVYVGLRDVDPAERAAIRRLGVQAYTMHDIDHYGIGQVMDMALAHLLKNDSNRPLHLSYDIDAIDPAHAPATGTAVRGGLTYREAHYVAEAVAASGLLASAEIAEVNPTLSDGDGGRETVELGLLLINSIMGQSIM